MHLEICEQEYYGTLTDYLMMIKDVIFCVLQIPLELKYGNATENSFVPAGRWMDAHG